MSEEDFKVVRAMEQYGGSFVKQLARLCGFADHDNLLKIKNTWSEYWETYRKMAERE